MFLNIISSSRLALVLVFLVILFSLAGVMLPQRGAMETKDITIWQENHPVATYLLEPAGAFYVFHSWPFMVTILLLGVNTFTCTVLHLIRGGGFLLLRGPQAIEKGGFVLLHLGLLVLFAGGFISAATRLDGYIVLTEGQKFTEHHDNYVRITEGPLRSEKHQGFDITLKKVQTKYEQKKFIVEMVSDLAISLNKKEVAKGTVKVNKPLSFKGMTFTQDETGFSPHLKIRDRQSGELLVNSFVALQTFSDDNDRQYRDFLPLPFLENRIIITLYPDYLEENGSIRKVGNEPDNPIILIEMQDSDGQVLAQGKALPGETVTVGKYDFIFADLRNWASFRVVGDPGYPVVCVALWIGIAALFLRYIPDMFKWFRDKEQPDE